MANDKLDSSNLSLSIFLIFKLIYTLSTFSRTRQVGVKNKMMESKCREIYEEVKSALGIVPSKVGKM